MAVHASLSLPLDGRADIAAALQLLTSWNRRHLAAHPSTPALYESGVRYKREPGREVWLPIGELLRLRFGDCEDLSCWRAAELGEEAIAIPRRVPGGWHIVVRRPDGLIEDPSRLLGMGAVA